MIGGNANAIVQQCDGYESNPIGERIPIWQDVQTLHGFLDYTGGDSKYSTYDTKLQESTHIWMCDYVAIDRNANNKRMIINGKVYDILLIDDPMELHQHLEIFLKYVG